MDFSKKNHYELLDVKPNASESEIKSAYKKMAFKWHPDRHKEDKGIATKMFQNINNAHEVLSDSEKRQAYDAKYGFNQQRRDPQEEFHSKKEKPVKAAKTTKHKHATSTANPPTVSDDELASMVSDGTLGTSTMEKLKTMLRERSLHVSGKKNELIERLEEYVKKLKKTQEQHSPPSPPTRPPTTTRPSPPTRPPPPTRPSPPQQQAPGIPEGCLVTLHSLNADDYNGKMAVVRTPVNENGRQLVELVEVQGNVAAPVGSQIFVRPENMAVVNEDDLLNQLAQRARQFIQQLQQQLHQRLQ